MTGKVQTLSLKTLNHGGEKGYAGRAAHSPGLVTPRPVTEHLHLPFKEVESFRGKGDQAVGQRSSSGQAPEV